MFINKVLNSTCKEQASVLRFALWENAGINYLMLRLDTTEKRI